ncbi:MAG TPA: oxygenase MpaB family protein [Candidatus Dormibacteraeota bacterium]|nr:oxygenase MpaB family protein [Candidatus Dormibacteraeota bacterium]
MASGSLNEDHGLFGPDSIIWRVNRESAVTLAGTCAILMQLAHPKVAAGVRDHSSYQVDVAGRLRRTLDLTMAIVFGHRRAAMRAVRTINSRHRAVRGPGYAATDPELLLWVQATLVYSAIHGYRALVGPLSDDEADQYYQDTKEIGVLLGVPREMYPAGVKAFEAYLQGMIDRREVAVGADARRLGEVILHPGFRGVPRMAFAPLTVITAGLLPPSLREGYRLKWGRGQRAAFAAFRAGLPCLLAIAPEPVRWLPPARDAYRRSRTAA